MDEEQDLQAVAGKFVPHEDEIARQIEAEWKARLQRGDAIALLHRNHNGLLPFFVGTLCRQSQQALVRHGRSGTVK